MAMKNKNGRHIFVRLDDETDWLLWVFAERRKLSQSDAIRDAIKTAASDTSLQRIADHLEEITRCLSDIPILTKNMLSLSAQMGDMAAANNANTDRLNLSQERLIHNTKEMSSVLDKMGSMNSSNAKLIWDGIKKLLMSAERQSSSGAFSVKDGDW